MADEPLLCMVCGKPAVDVTEYDAAEDSTWVYCRACDCWTEHPPTPRASTG